MDIHSFLYSSLGAALVSGVLLFLGLFYMYGTDGRYQKMENKDLLRVFFLPTAIVAATMYWFVSGREAAAAAAAPSVTAFRPSPIEVPAAPEFDPAPAPSTPILTEPFSD
jgi:hypothetical protein